MKIQVLCAGVFAAGLFFASASAAAQAKHLADALPASGKSSSLPTADLPPAVIDAQWQKASGKFDAARAALLHKVDQGVEKGPFRADWASLQQYKVPEWFRDAKFGIFIHWGVYSVPAFGSEWYPHEMYTAGTDDYKHQLATYGPLDKKGYKDFIPQFRAQHFDPVAWAHLFKLAGAQYVVPVFEHHDGFAMYDSSLTDWDAVKMGPHRDVLGELERAVRAEGMHFGASSHRIEHDWFMAGGRKLNSDVNDPRYAAFYGPAHEQLEDGDSSLLNDWTYISPEFLDDWLARDAEIVEKYHPDLMWFDWWIGQPAVRPYLARFAAFYYNQTLRHGTVGVINYKYNAMMENSAVLDLERGELGKIRLMPWQTDTSISIQSWGYIQNDTFRSAQSIVQQLVDVVSKNGNLLLNIGPRADGTIPDEVQQRLLDIGAWLKSNGEAIYGTRPWHVFGEGPTRPVEGAFHDTDVSNFTAQDFRFTAKGNLLYAIELAWPSSGSAVIHSLGSNQKNNSNTVASVTLLSTHEAVPFRQEKDGLHLQVPVSPPGKYAYAYRICFTSR